MPAAVAAHGSEPATVATCRATAIPTGAGIDYVLGYALRSPELLRFISAIDALDGPAPEGAFEDAIALAGSPAERDVERAARMGCPGPDERVALARALLAVDRLWRPRAYAGEADIASFTAMLQAALSAVANPTALSAQQRQTALLPFAKIPNLLAATEPPAPPPRPHTCAGPDIDARTIHAVTPREILDATGTYGSVDVHIELTSGGDVSSVSVAANHLRGDAGAAERIHAALEAAAESTFAPATRNCIAIPGGYIFAVEFAAPFGAHR